MVVVGRFFILLVILGVLVYYLYGLILNWDTHASHFMIGPSYLLLGLWVSWVGDSCLRRGGPCGSPRWGLAYCGCAARSRASDI
jgi:hypothetical protein